MRPCSRSASVTSAASALAAAKNISSVMSRALLAMTPSPTPGKTYALFPWPGTNRLPSTTTGSKGLPLELGDVLILCSDGVSNLVPNEKIAEIAGAQAPQDACNALIEAALAAGGYDNASLGIFSVERQAEAKSAPEPTTRRIKIPIEPDNADPSS